METPNSINIGNSDREIIFTSPNLSEGDEVLKFIALIMTNAGKTMHLLCDGEGGDLTNLYKILFYKKYYDVTFITYTTSETYSANSLLFLSGKKRIMSSFCLFHLHDVQISATFSVSNRKFTEALLINRAGVDKLVCSINPEILQYIHCTGENYLSPKECKELKICTHIKDYL